MHELSVKAKEGTTMRSHPRLLMTALTAALILSAAITATATARRLLPSNTGIRAVWNELTFSSEREAGGIEWTCPLTLEGTFHSRTISKVSGQLIGFITRAALNAPACAFVGGAESFVILQGSLPWHIRYASFEGMLPRIRSIRLQLIGVAFLLTAIGVSCLYLSTAAFPLFSTASLSEVTGASTGMQVESETPIRRFSGSIVCPTELFFRGSSAPITLLGTTTIISIRLVQ